MTPPPRDPLAPLSRRSTRRRSVDMVKRPIAECDVMDRQALRDLIAECAGSPTRRISSLRPGAASLQSDVSEFHDGLVIPGTRYRVISLLGSGGMGNVYDVEHTELGKRFVLKALHRGLCTRDELVTRLRTEWRALGRLEHPNIVAVTDAGRTQLGLSYFVMERLEGETLQVRLRREGRLRVPDALRIAEGLFEALSAAHAIGVVHRDIKPPNLFLTREGGIKLLDFGIAKITDESTAAITQRGVAVGTPRYMSPEQARGERVDGRADLYAVGLLLFEMIIGHGPFDDRARDANELLIAQLTETPRRLSSIAPSVSAAVDEFVAQLLEKDWRLRPATAREAAERARELSARYGFGPDTREVTVAAGYDEPTRASWTPKPRARGLPTLRQIDDGQRDITTVMQARESLTTGVLGTPQNGVVASERRDVTLLDATRENPGDRRDPSWVSESHSAALGPVFETLVDPTPSGRTAATHSRKLIDDAERAALVDSGPVTRADGIAARASHPDAYEVRVTSATPPPVAATAVAVAPRRTAPPQRRSVRGIVVGAVALAAGGLATWALTAHLADDPSSPATAVPTTPAALAAARPAPEPPLPIAPRLVASASAPSAPALAAPSAPAAASASSAGAKARRPTPTSHKSLLPASGL